MPYIDKAQRKVLDPYIDALSGVIEIGNAGELNYVLTRLAARFLLNEGGLDYARINEVAGVLQKVAAEFDARVTRPYEDLKITKNGDVPEYSDISDRIAELQAKVFNG
jgi:hypothetical protein